MELRKHTGRSGVAPKIYEPGKPVLLRGETFTVAAFVARGRRSNVYRVQNARGQEFALKVALDDRRRTLDSIRKEHRKVRPLAAHDIPHAAVVDRGDNFVLKKWVEGIRGDAWLRRWRARGCRRDAPALVELIALIRKLADKRIFIRDLNSHNLIWDGRKWVIVDWGNVKRTISASRLRERYRELLAFEWGGGESVLPAPDQGKRTA